LTDDDLDVFRVSAAGGVKKMRGSSGFCGPGFSLLLWQLIMLITRGLLI